ncbi:hypothetical protein FIV00_26755 [Labrenzia sp. THAF82]|uniref:hypothetical protein n=1 Tax=Labrenzia sp. THAF82 TaxID=2587861 RepID=UPI001267C457|nr:hypothetical protein [Labrenzia sp. THAF82]QFT34125.1 hypothetical protein FIV00_26755 [Labrenzia sp. THAF82]
MEMKLGGSGSSGGWSPFSGSGSGNGSGKDPCDLRFQVDLFGPNASVFNTLTEGDRLSVQLQTQGQSTSVVVIDASTGQVAGTITGSSQLGVLVNCLQNGEIYEAEISAINGSQVTVTIERV